MKTTTTTVACFAATLFLSGSALMANGGWNDRDDRGSRCEIRAELRNERRPQLHSFQSQRAQALRLREAKLLAELAELRAREARMQRRTVVGFQATTSGTASYVDRRTQNLGTTYLANQSQTGTYNTNSGYTSNSLYNTNAAYTQTAQYAPAGYQTASYARPSGRTGLGAR